MAEKLIDEGIANTQHERADRHVLASFYDTLRAGVSFHFIHQRWKRTEQNLGPDDIRPYIRNATTRASY